MATRICRVLHIIFNICNGILLVQGTLRVNILSGIGSNAPWVSSKELISLQIRAYWDCYERKAHTSIGHNKSAALCPATFDGWGCWGSAEPGTTAEIPCPEFNVTESTLESDVLVSRLCTASGNWERNYETQEDVVDYTVCGIDVTSVDSQLLYHVIQELSSLEHSPYDDPWTAHAFEECLDTVLAAPRHHGAVPFCPRTFDGWGCWNDTLPGRTAYIPCPGFITGFLPERSAHKECNPDGTWFRHPDTNKVWSNYTTCVDREDLAFRQRIVNTYIAGYSTSVIALLISLAIFFYFRSVQCTRITIHKQLFISFIINNIMWIIWYTQVVQKTDVLSANGIPCQLLHVLVHYFLVSNYMWMFCEGLYLHTLLVVAFVAEDRLLKWFFLVGWGTPLLIISVYAGVRNSSTEDTQLCWIEESSYSWIISGPVCISMLLNLVFLVNIVRVLVTKLRAVNSPDTHQTRKAVRATLILIPLLGLHYVVTPFRPVERSPGEAIYETISAVVTSFQGLCVAFLFCFFNGEVISLVRKKWHQALLMRGRRMSYAATNVSHPKRPSAATKKSLLAAV